MREHLLDPHWTGYHFWKFSQILDISSESANSVFKVFREYTILNVISAFGTFVFV